MYIYYYYYSNTSASNKNITSVLQKQNRKSFPPSGSIYFGKVYDEKINEKIPCEIIINYNNGDVRTWFNRDANRSLKTTPSEDLNSNCISNCDFFEIITFCYNAKSINHLINYISMWTQQFWSPITPEMICVDYTYQMISDNYTCVR